jgi:hypothetical protein
VSLPVRAPWLDNLLRDPGRGIDWAAAKQRSGGFRA